MYTKLFYFLIAICILCVPAYAYEEQGTSVKRVGCDVVIVLQIAVESDSNDDHDVAILEAALKGYGGCWNFSCDMPCRDILKGNCKIRSEIVIKKWRELGAADRKKFHHVKMLSGWGTCEVDELFSPNSKKSTGGKWYRKKDPKVFCHETMHLAGLPDRYCDCRPERLALGVDNCKDGDTCTQAQKDAGSCPSCPGYENDCMGNDVRKPFDCQRNMMEVLKLAGARFTYCTDSCCQEYHTPQNDYDPLGTLKKPDSTKPKTEGKIGMSLDAGLGLYHFANKTLKTDKLNLTGYNLALAVNYQLILTHMIAVQTFIQINMMSVSKERTYTQGITTYNDNQHYRFLQAAIGANIIYALARQYSLFAGPEIGYTLGSKYKSEGTATTNGMSYPYTTNGYINTTAGKNILAGLNLGAMTSASVGGMGLHPYINIHVPFTNTLQFPTMRNKAFRFSLGACLMFGK